MKETQEPGKDPIILVVEDSRSIFSELQRSIEGSIGFRTEVVSTYADAREFLNWRAKEVFLAILDLHLPDSTSGEIVDLFCSMAVPSIVFTSDLTESTRKRMLSKEIIDYVVKDAHAISNLLGYIRRLKRNTETKVLVVEDSDSFRFSLCAMLHQQMFQVFDVSNAEDGLEVLEREGDISVVITDYEMPGMNGVDLTRKIRADHNKDQIAIVGLSSSDDPMLTARFIKSGANDFIAKPFEIEEFNCRIDHNVDILESIQELKAANTVKNEFLGMAVHDLRSPINGIKGLSEMLLEGLCGEMTEEQKELIEYIHTANMQMNALVGDLLDISVIEAGKLRLAQDDTALGDVIEERLRIHTIGAKKKGISITSTLDDLGPFYFDSRRIGQVLDNLLTNALKFSPVGSTIEVTLQKKGEGAQVCIRDHGQGIPPDEKELVFRSFAKTSVLPTAGESSTGLGLPIVRKVVEAHDGKVWVDSEYGEGATFCFTLPLKTSL